VKRVLDGVVQGVVLDLSVNFASERGLLGIALHPEVSTNGWVYLYWTCRGPAAGVDCEEGLDTDELARVPLLGNRVDRFGWDGTTLTFDRNLIRLRAFQADADQNGLFNQPLRGNHDGGKLTFGPDGKLYILIGDNGRRGWLQNIETGTLPNGRDDQFGGPAPDDAHLTGVILRLNDDGTSPEDNPFVDAGHDMEGEVGANLQKIFAYGLRNSFGMAFDPLSGTLFTEENGDDSFTELNRVESGFNGGWVQIIGPVERVAEYKAIETGPRRFGLQQVRWPPTRIADTPEEALERLFLLPGAQYTEPLLSWKFEVAPGGLGFVRGQGLGPAYAGDLIVGAAVTSLLGGQLWRLQLNGDRREFIFSDPRLDDGVADNLDKYDLTESESLLFGQDFGIVTDIQTGPTGTLLVVSLSNGAIYEIHRR
jgi:aldose sugar dehydrogenase